jgi:hypothetical protein
MVEYRPQKSQDKLEQLISNLNQRIENLKIQFNLFFAGELRIPPENEREDIEKKVQGLQLSQHKSPKSTLLIQNLSSTFSIYNNMWKKRLNEIETGLVTIQKKKTVYIEEPKPTPEKEYCLDVSLNREESFENYFAKYHLLSKQGPAEEAQKEEVINSLKAKLISQNLIDAKVILSVSKGKLKLKIKEQ